MHIVNVLIFVNTYFMFIFWLSPSPLRDGGSLQTDVVFQLYFTQASDDLFRATKNRVYFRDITILVPKVGAVYENWTSD